MAYQALLQSRERTHGLRRPVRVEFSTVMAAAQELRAAVAEVAEGVQRPTPGLRGLPKSYQTAAPER